MEDLMQGEVSPLIGSRRSAMTATWMVATQNASVGLSQEDRRLPATPSEGLSSSRNRTRTTFHFLSLQSSRDVTAQAFHGLPLKSSQPRSSSATPTRSLRLIPRRKHPPVLLPSSSAILISLTLPSKMETPCPHSSLLMATKSQLPPSHQITSASIT